MHDFQILKPKVNMSNHYRVVGCVLPITYFSFTRDFCGLKGARHLGRQHFIAKVSEALPNHLTSCKNGRWH